MKSFTFLVILLNLFTFIFYNYEYRIDHSLYFPTNFLFRDYIEVFCYSYFTLEILLKIIATGLILGKNSYLRDMWHCFFLITLIASWAIYIPENPIIKLCLSLRVLGAVRLILIYNPTKKNLTNIVKALFSVANYFVAVFCLMLVYSVIGLYLFYGLDKNRCRATPHPEHNSWEVIEGIESFCGNWQCSKGFFNKYYEMF